MLLLAEHKKDWVVRYKPFTKHVEPSFLSHFAFPSEVGHEFSWLDEIPPHWDAFRVRVVAFNLDEHGERINYQIEFLGTYWADPKADQT